MAQNRVKFWGLRVNSSCQWPRWRDTNTLALKFRCAFIFVGKINKCRVYMCFMVFQWSNLLSSPSPAPVVRSQQLPGRWARGRRAKQPRPQDHCMTSWSDGQWLQISADTTRMVVTTSDHHDCHDFPRHPHHDHGQGGDVTPVWRGLFPRPLPLPLPFPRPLPRALLSLRSPLRADNGFSKPRWCGR